MLPIFRSLITDLENREIRLENICSVSVGKFQSFVHFQFITHESGSC